jgi:hypothetical protein
VTIVEHITRSKMRCDAGVSNNAILESSQRVVMSDDVFFEHNPTRQRDPSLVALKATGCERKPFVLTRKITD